MKNLLSLLKLRRRRFIDYVKLNGETRHFIVHKVAPIQPEQGHLVGVETLEVGPDQKPVGEPQYRTLCRNQIMADYHSWT